jgi:hypothetical protein
MREMNMRFIETVEGRLVPISKVVVVKEHNESCVAVFTSADQYIAVCPISEFAARFADIIPAAPGFEVLSLYDFGLGASADDEFSYSRQTVIAWAAIANRLVPLVASGDAFWREEAIYAILDLSGRVSELGYWREEFDNLEAWEASARARFERKERAWRPHEPPSADEI